MRLIQEIGSYAGFAAVVGLAVLSALYFSQARDVRRLREWAGRAPERDAEARSRVVAAGQGRPGAATPAASGAAAATAPAVPATAGNSGGKAAAGAATAAGAGAATAAGQRGGGVAAPPRPPASRVGSGHTAILGVGAEPPRERWYRRLAPRYIALIVAGVLVVGGGIAVGVVKLLDNGGGSTGTPAAQTGGASGGGGSSSAPQAPIRPGDVTVAVFNSTSIPGLAATYGEKIDALGFKKDSVGQAPANANKAESVVFYVPGKKREAQLVRRKLGISNIEPVDGTFRGLAPNAEAIVVLGANATQ
ncbi:MAG: hypothetical protein QOJ07_3020 [Thermoleophilaceae bacterium]|nr:hypothetical protein [Thermoleophilaceae bacterium]